jgi:hypothetical protein
VTPRGQPLLRRALVLTHLACAGVGVYLLAWAQRWPHSDLREAWAVGLGCASLVAGVVAAASSQRLRTTGQLVAAAVTGALLVGGIWGLTVLGHDQARACGDRLPQCRSLLPGL